MYYKYRSLKTKNDRKRLKDIVEKGRLYVAKYDNLNDPLEGAYQRIRIAENKTRIYDMEDKEHPRISALREKFRILSLSDQYDVPQMWAHYARNYEGVCLCFDDSAFPEIRKVLYDNEVTDLPPFDIDDEEKISQAIRESFFQKSEGWKYESEYRVVKIPRHSKDCYYEFPLESLKGIIAGSALKSDGRKILEDLVYGTDIHLLETSFGRISLRINIVDYDFKPSYSKKSIPAIKDLERFLLTGKDKGLTYIQRAIEQ